jgi:aminoglycoside phosphotransferase (APT) family kinase protein
VTGADPATGSVPLRDWQLLDWRFLLPPDAERVGYVGAVEPAELAAVRDAGLHLVAHPSPERRVQVAVVTSSDLPSVDGAVAALEPGGWLLLRATAAAAPIDPLGPRRRRRWTRELTARGLQQVATFWHAPDLRRCSYIVDVDDPVAVGTMLGRFHGVRFGLLKSVVGRLLNRLGIVDVAARDITVVAWLPEGGDHKPTPRAFPLQPPATPPADDLDATPWSVLLMTPWFEASRHVLALYVATRTRRIAAVAKLPRRSWDVGGIETEAAALRAVEAGGPALERAAPRVLQERLEGPRPYLVQSGVVGTAIGPEVVRRSPAAVLDAGTALIDRLASPETSTAASVARLVDAPLDRLAAALALDEASMLVERSKTLLQPLRSARVPAVLEHGDFGHPNLVLVAGNRMTAIDWERFEPAGLPGLDLVFFLQYIKECLAKAVTVESQLEAFDQAFVGPDAWARPALQRYAAQLRIPEALLPGLVLATWCRTAAGLVPRLEPRSFSPGSSPGHHIAAGRHVAQTITTDRDYLLWRHAVQRFEAILR